MRNYIRKKYIKMQQSEQRGYIHLIIGCMFSSKTTKLLQIMEQFEIIGKKSLYVKFTNDNRYSEDYIQTHSQLKSIKKAINCSNLMDIYDQAQEYDVIAIEEVQFYTNAIQFIEQSANNNKILIITGLNSDYKRNGFQVVLDLIPLSDKITFQRAICQFCKHKASFSFRNAKSQDQIFISNNYISLCRICYQKQQQ